MITNMNVGEILVAFHPGRILEKSLLEQESTSSWADSAIPPMLRCSLIFSTSFPNSHDLETHIQAVVYLQEVLRFQGFVGHNRLLLWSNHRQSGFVHSVGLVVLYLLDISK